MARETAAPSRRFPCWRTDVGLLIVECSLQRCPHWNVRAPSHCDFNDPDREHSVPEIAALLGLSIAEVEQIERSGYHKYSNQMLREGVGRLDGQYLR